MKRFIWAAIFTALLFIMAACSAGGLGGAPQATAAPTSSTSRNTQTVKVNETVANAQTVPNATAGQTAAPTSTAAPADTPATGDFPVVYLAGVLGLILLCSAGLLILRRI